MEQPTLKCLSYFIDCDNKPTRFNNDLIEFLKTKINVQKMDNKGRSLVYEITRKVILEKRRISSTIDSDLIYSLIHMIEGESKKKPLSDEKLTELLQEKGYNIARRTVAKYREQLNIPVARLRKIL